MLCTSISSSFFLPLCVSLKVDLSTLVNNEIHILTCDLILERSSFTCRHVLKYDVEIHYICASSCTSIRMFTHVFPI